MTNKIILKKLICVNQVKVTHDDKITILCGRPTLLVVVVCRLAGQGHFGEVLVGKAYNIVADATETLVMLKSLLSADESIQTEFYRELELFSRCNHDNVVKLLGISRESLPVFAIYEYTDLVSLCSVR